MHVHVSKHFIVKYGSYGIGRDAESSSDPEEKVECDQGLVRVDAELLQ